MITTASDPFDSLFCAHAFVVAVELLITHIKQPIEMRTWRLHLHWAADGFNFGMVPRALDFRRGFESVRALSGAAAELMYLIGLKIAVLARI